MTIFNSFLLVYQRVKLPVPACTILWTGLPNRPVAEAPYHVSCSACSACGAEALHGTAPQGHHAECGGQTSPAVFGLTQLSATLNGPAMHSVLVGLRSKLYKSLQQRVQLEHVELLELGDGYGMIWMDIMHYSHLQSIYCTHFQNHKVKRRASLQCSST